MQAELVVDCKNRHGEGVFWNPQDGHVWWTDIEGRALWSFDPVSHRHRRHAMTDRVCCFAPRAGGQGMIVAFADRIVLMDRQMKEERVVTQFEPQNRETRLNDGRTDRAGRLIAGGMNEVSGAADSSVLAIDTTLAVRVLFSGVACANSTCFSPDGATMYFADTPDRRIIAFDYDMASGTASNRRVHASFENEPGLPDGSCVDAQGGVWNAVWEGRRVVRVAPDGRIDRIVAVPVWKPTCCAFGGPDLDTLFITTSCLGSDSEVVRAEPGSGGLFAVQPGFRGVTDAPFGG